jgi:hypothetical protein
MRVGVSHRLARVGTGIKDDPISARRDALGHRDPMRLGDHLVEQAIARRGDGGQIGSVLPRDNQYMDGGLGIDVTESDRGVTLQHAFRGDVTGGDFAKETLGHGGILTCARSGGPPTYMVTVLRTHDAPPLWCAVSAMSWLSVAAGALHVAVVAMRSRNGQAWGEVRALRNIGARIVGDVGPP